jgi:hypothetical protein
MFSSVTRRTHLALMLALGVYLVLSLGQMTEMGVVGEVAWTWVGGHPNANLALPLPTHTWGPFTAASTRPMASMAFGDFRIPLIVNLYTGGLADWPARLVAPLGFEAISLIHILLGGLLILLVHRFLRIHGSGIAAGTAALLLATDWVFVFTRRALGGTEVLLSAASLLCLWALWSRRWAGGRHGLVALAAGVGLGFSAKLTFGLTLMALALTALLTRRDKPRLRPPLPDRWGPVILALVLPVLPMLVGLAHLWLADLDPLATHDHLATQLDRVWATLKGQPRPARESLAALTSWAGNPVSFLSAAWGAETPSWLSPLRFLGWGLVIAGTGLAWADRDPTPRLALTRFCSVFLVLQVLLIWGIARDLHHLAVATPTLMILAGLSLDTLGGQWAPPRSARRGMVVALAALPWIWVGSHAITDTDDALMSINRPTISRTGQTAVIEMLRRQGATRVITLDYESAGALDIGAPEIEFQHGWTRILADRSTALEALLSTAAGAHLLVIKDAPAWTYNLRPRPADLDAAGARAGVETVAVDRLPDDAAVLYAVDSQTGRP